MTDRESQGPRQRNYRDHSPQQASDFSAGLVHIPIDCEMSLTAAVGVHLSKALNRLCVHLINTFLQQTSEVRQKTGGKGQTKA